MQKIGVTERGDPVFDHGWESWVRNGNPAILITKSPDVLYSTLMCMKRSGINLNVIVHATITGYGGTVLEPRVPQLEDSIRGYGNLIDLLGSDRVVLRIDPIITTDKGFHAAEKVLYKAMMERPKPRVRISFLDMYPHVKQRFIDAGLPIPYETFNAPQGARWHAWKILGEPEVCGEPGLPNTPCISEKECEIFGVQPVKNDCPQRKTCGCLGNKYELLKGMHRCHHGCLYCYWKD